MALNTRGGASSPMTRLTAASAWHAAGVAAGLRRAGDHHRWERCVNHRSDEIRPFTEAHFGEEHRRILLVAGAGFDSRATTAARLLAEVLGSRLEAILLKERRFAAGASLGERAEGQLRSLRELLPSSELLEVEVFEADGAVALGRRVVVAMQGRDLTAFTDVVVDFSALSIGASFPLTKWIFGNLESASAQGRVINLHAMVTASPRTDELVTPRPSDRVGPVHGFQGRLGIDETANAARLWMPQLRLGIRPSLERVYGSLSPPPDDVVPVLPFPADDPRMGDRLIYHYRTEFELPWQVDARSLVYAAEHDPLGFYRTILRIHDQRHPVFERTGGSLLILSPVGTKVLALGAMMAAIERDLPVVYVEALSYDVELDAMAADEYTESDLVHVWLLGEAYPRPPAD